MCDLQTIETIEIEADIRDAAATLLDNKFGCLPVMEGNVLTGIITESDFVEFVRTQAGWPARRTA